MMCSNNGALFQPDMNFPRLRVEDAVSYLDQIKSKYQNQPEVYHEFLDVMKEFKSARINSLDVITRVSYLFKDYPDLFDGFNAFLPPGLSVKVQTNDQGYAYQMFVSTPSPPSTQTFTILQHPGSDNINSPPMKGNYQHSPTNNISKDAIEAPSQDGVSSNEQLQQSQLIEFNHALNYVNKVKERFQDEPNKYKRFMEILHTYQRKQQNLHESGEALPEAEVYNQVAEILENQDDLLLEFKQLLGWW